MCHICHRTMALGWTWLGNSWTWVEFMKCNKDYPQLHHLCTIQPPAWHMYYVHKCYWMQYECLEAQGMSCTIFQKWYTDLLSDLAGRLYHIANISCRWSPKLFKFLDIGRYSVHTDAYKFSKQADKNAICKATSKVAFCAFPATSGAGWPGHPNFEMA